MLLVSLTDLAKNFLKITITRNPQPFLVHIDDITAPLPQYVTIWTSSQTPGELVPFIRIPTANRKKTESWKAYLTSKTFTATQYMKQRNLMKESGILLVSEIAQAPEVDVQQLRMKPPKMHAETVKYGKGKGVKDWLF